MRVYFDHSATTSVKKEILSTMLPYFKDKYGNPSEVHKLGVDAKTAVENSRNTIAKYFQCQKNEIIFTSGATESINLAHKGFIESIETSKGKSLSEIITTPIEHKAVLETLSHLERNGKAKIIYTPVDNTGLIQIEKLNNLITNRTRLISVIFVNNEIGTVQPIGKIADLISRFNEKRKEDEKILLHLDATQAIGYFDCNIKKLKYDMLSMSGHKIGAPKGVGLLIVKEKIEIVRQNDGGSQEGGLRAGTENVAFIVGLAKAIEIAHKNIRDKVILVNKVSGYLKQELLKIPDLYLTGHPDKRSPHIISMIIKGVEGEAVVLYLSNKNIYASSGSACTTHNLNPSHVLTAIGVPAEDSHGSLRFSLDATNTIKEVEYVLKILPIIVKKLRKMAPNLYDSQ